MANSSSSVRGLNLEGEEDLMPDQRLQGEGRTTLAQRRAVHPPSAINTAPASPSATAATPAAGSAASPRLPSTVPSTPSMTMRRRTSLVAESDSPATTAGHPLSPRTPHLPYYLPHSPNPTDAGLHLQQARASVVQVATGVQDGGRKRSFVDGASGGGPNGAGAAGTTGGMGGGAKRQSSHPPPAPSSTFRLGSILSSSSSHPSNGLPPVVASPPVSSDDHLMNLTPSDLRRPSFLATAVSTAKSLSSSSSSSSAPNPRRFLLFFPSRRMQKTFRLWALAALALLAFIKVVDFFLLPSTSTTMLRNLRTASTSSPSSEHLPHTPSPPSDQLPDSFAAWVARGQAPLPPSYAQQPPLAASPAAEVRKPFQVQLGNADPNEGLLVEAEQSRLPFEKAWDERMARLSPEEEEERKKRELVLNPVELADMRRNRRERLWGPPEEDLWVEVAKPAKGHLHESTIIFLHGLGERAVDSFMPIHLHKQFPNTRWVLPQAPKRPVTALSASLHPAWFDIDSFPYNPYTDRDPDGLFASVRALNRVIAEERALLIRNLRRRGGGVSPGPRGGEGYATSVGPDGAGEGKEGEEFGTPAEREWASQRVVVAGFSQGSVVALLSALTFPERLGGVAVFSGFLPIREDLSKLIVDLDRKDLPVFWGHGQDDPYLLFTDALTSISLLSPSYVPTFPHSPLAIPSSLASDHPSYILNLTSVTFQSYVGLGHTWAWPELQDVARFLEGVLPKGVQRGERLPRNLGAEPVVEQKQEVRVVPPPPAPASPPPVPPVPPVEGGEGGGGMRRMRR